MGREISADDAKARLPELLRQVADGERFTITHRGRPVAELAPVGRPASSAGQAVKAMAAFERVRGVNADDIAAFVDDGRD